MQPYRELAVLASALLALAASGAAAGADDGAKIVAEVCSQCHTPKRNPLDNVHLTKGQWSETLERMVGYGAELPKSKMPELLDYLVRTHGRSGAAADADKK